MTSFVLQAKACSSSSIARLKNLNKRTVDVLASRLYFYYSLSYELTGDLAEIRGWVLYLINYQFITLTFLLSIYMCVYINTFFLKKISLTRTWVMVEIYRKCKGYGVNMPNRTSKRRCSVWASYHVLKAWEEHPECMIIFLEHLDNYL